MSLLMSHNSLILGTLEQPVEGGRRQAYLYAVLAFACQVSYEA
jgi:hypothetical protein